MLLISFDISTHSFTAPLDIINMTAEEMPSNSQRSLVFVGVMTSKDFLETRAQAVYNTWGKLVPGRIAFFSSEGSYSDGKYHHKYHLILIRSNPHCWGFFCVCARK